MKKKIFAILALFTIVLSGCFNQEKTFVRADFLSAQKQYKTTVGISYTKVVKQVNKNSQGVIEMTIINTYEDNIEFGRNQRIEKFSSDMRRGHQDAGLANHRNIRYYHDGALYIHDISNVELKEKVAVRYENHYDEEHHSAFLHHKDNLIPIFEDEEMSEFTMVNNKEGAVITFKARPPKFIPCEGELEEITYTYHLNKYGELSFIEFEFCTDTSTEYTITITINKIGSYVSVIDPFEDKSAFALRN